MLRAKAVEPALMRWLPAVIAIFALANCEVSHQGGALEARARAGDVSAACDLVLQDLQQCAAARKDWMVRPESPRPACLGDPVPAYHHRYFAQSIETLEGPPERRELLKIISDGAANTAASLRLGVGAPERFDSAIDIIAQSCATLRG
jgi:hypothetical protein